MAKGLFLFRQTILPRSVRYKIRDQHGLNYVTCSICGWVDLFSRAIYRDVVLDSWRYCAQPKGWQIWGYVITTNHLHMIVSTTPPFRLRSLVSVCDAKCAVGKSPTCE